MTAKQAINSGFASESFTTWFQLHSREKAMRKPYIFTYVILAAVMMPAIGQLHAATQTINGVISDSMCGKKHMMAGKSAAECVQECVKAGSSYALVAGAKVYMLAGKPAAIAPFAGKQVRIEGDVKGGTITVSSIHDAAQKK
jgi:hypothetical protein